jgi:predicted sulfurtransferase
MSVPVLNLSCYKFSPLEDLLVWKQRLSEVCQVQGVKGTILLAPEGINFFLAGTRQQLDGQRAVFRGAQRSIRVGHTAKKLPVGMFVVVPSVPRTRPMCLGQTHTRGCQ